MKTKEEILEILRRDCNRYSAQELQIFVKDGILGWSDLSEIYGERQLRAIYEYEPPVHHPYQGSIDTSQSGLEIYVWGDYRVGKTCFTGAICSVLRASGVFEPQSEYAIQLSHMFHSDVCTLPMAALNNIHVAKFRVRNEKGKADIVYIIEMSSKIGKVMAKALMGIELSCEEYDLLQQTMSYLRNSQNYKIHYFLMEYARVDENTRKSASAGMTQESFLSSIARFLHNHGIFPDKNTLEVCGLVTKCDRIDEDKASSIMTTFPPSERPLRAYNYVRKSFNSFWRTIADICTQSKIPTICISYSIGKVFAQNLCEFDPSDTAKIIEHLQSIFKKNIF